MAPSPELAAAPVPVAPPPDELLEQLKHANFYLRIALDQVPEGVLIVENQPLQGEGPKVMFSNAGAACLLGVDPTRGLRGMRVGELLATPDEAERMLATMQRAHDEGGSAECLCLVRNFYGRPPQMCRWRVRAVLNSMRRLLNFTLTVAAEPPAASEPTATRVVPAVQSPPCRTEDLDAQSERLRTENLAALAQGIAHDVNNLLGPVTARLSSLLQQVEPNSDTGRDLQLVFAGLKRARQFTSQVVSASRGKAGKRQPTDLKALVCETVRLSRAGSNVEVRIDLPENLYAIEADAVRVSQVLQNLVMNGMQAMPTGGFMDVEASNVEIGLGGDERLKPGRYVKVVVRDRGCGITPENQARLFHESFTTKIDGNGIGLTTCMRFIEEHQGDIRVTSTVNVGTEFVVFLPAMDGSPASRAMGSDAPVGPIPLQPGTGTVLIVDDEDDLRRVAAAILGRCGYTVIQCDSGQEAVELYESQSRRRAPVDVVLMDLTLRGGMNGTEAARAILNFDPDARLVVTSGSVNEEVQRIFLEQGFISALPKPYEAGELTRVVFDAIKRVTRQAA